MEGGGGGVGGGGGGSDRNTFLVETNERCFMCLEDVVCDSDNIIFNWHTSILPFKLLSRYLAVDVPNVFEKTCDEVVAGEEEEVTRNRLPLNDKAKVAVPLCDRCSEKLDRFSTLYHQMKVLRLKVDQQVQDIEGMMTSAEGLFGGGNFDEERGGGGGVVELSFAAKLVDNLRKEIIEKCILNSYKAPPWVALQSIDDDDDDEGERTATKNEQSQEEEETEESFRTFGDLLMEGEDANNSTFDDDNDDDDDSFYNHLHDTTDDDDPEDNVIPSEMERTQTDDQHHHHQRQPVENAPTGPFWRWTSSGSDPYAMMIPVRVNDDDNLESNANEVVPNPAYSSSSSAEPAQPPPETPSCSNKLDAPTYAMVARRSGRQCRSVVKCECCVHGPKSEITDDGSIIIADGGDDDGHCELNGVAAVASKENATNPKAPDHAHPAINRSKSKRSSASGSGSNAAATNKSPKNNLKGEAAAAVAIKRGRGRPPLKLEWQEPKTTNCKWCDEPFHCNKQLWRHTYQMHRQDCLSKFKNPKLRTERFESIIDDMLNTIIGAKQSGKLYCCPFCDTLVNSIKLDVKVHLLRAHMKKLTPKLKALQQNQLENVAPEEVGPSAPGPSSNVSNPLQKPKQKRKLSKEEAPHKEAKKSPRKTTAKSPRGNPKSSKKKLVRPLIITTRVTKPGQVKYKNLPNGKAQCLLCSKIVGKQNKKYHAGVHTGTSSFSCPHCDQSFGYHGNLRYHLLKRHISRYFIKYKDARVSSEQFDAMILQVFEKLNVTRVPRSDATQRYPTFTCIYCDKVCRNREDMHGHLILVHMNKLAPKLKARQKKLLLAADS